MKDSEKFVAVCETTLQLCRDVREQMDLLEASVEQLRDRGVAGCIEESHHHPAIYTENIRSGMTLVDILVHLTAVYHNLQAHQDSFSPFEWHLSLAERDRLERVYAKVADQRKAWFAKQKDVQKGEWDTDNWLDELLKSGGDSGGGGEDNA